MCLAIPGRIIGINKDIITIEFPHEKTQAVNTGFDLKEGEYVFVQTGIVVQKVPKEETIESLKAWEEVSKD